MKLLLQKNTKVKLKKDLGQKLWGLFKNISNGQRIFNLRYINKNRGKS